ncbi:hypothetical protein K474DRAFT_1681026, partial [Panus rudis PR-1116 ss-1]
ISVRLDENQPTFTSWKGGLPEKEKMRYREWASVVVPPNPPEFQKGAPSDGQVLAPDSQGEVRLPSYEHPEEQSAESLMLLLSAYLQARWESSGRKEEVDWAAVAQDPASYVTPRWVHEFESPLPELDKFSLVLLYRRLLKVQGEGNPFAFNGNDLNVASHTNAEKENTSDMGPASFAPAPPFSRSVSNPLIPAEEVPLPLSANIARSMADTV